MFVVVNVERGKKLEKLMEHLVNKCFSFAVTDNPIKFCRSLALQSTETTLTQSGSTSISSTGNTIATSQLRREETPLLGDGFCDDITPPERESRENTVVMKKMKSEQLSNSNNGHSSYVLLDDCIASPKERIGKYVNMCYRNKVKLQDALSMQFEHSPSTFQQSRCLTALGNEFTETERMGNQIKPQHVTREDSLNYNDDPSASTFLSGNGFRPQEDRFREITIQGEGISEVNKTIKSRRPSSSCTRVRCRTCLKDLWGGRTTKRRHVILHLQLKPWKCVLCDLKFNRQELARPHYQKYHPDESYNKFENALTAYQKQKINQEMTTMFNRL